MSRNEGSRKQSNIRVHQANQISFLIKYMLGGNEYILCSQWENKNHKFGYSNQINLQF